MNDLMIPDIKILTLKKHHYANSHKRLKGQYSCWGHFDVMSINDCDVNGGKLSSLWHGMMEESEKADGTNSHLNISLIRFADHKLKANLDRVFLCACFICMEDLGNLSITDILESFERLFQGRKEVVDVQCYRTMDNADAVAIIQSNDYEKIMEAVLELGEQSGVAYTHSICGVSIKYLKQFEENARRLDGLLPNVNNTKLSKIIMHISGKGMVNIKIFLQDLVARIFPNQTVTCFSMLGHIDATAIVEDTDMEHALRMMIEGGGINHDAPVYQKKLYNMETHLLYNEELIKPIRSAEDMSVESPSWCKEKLKEFKKITNEVKTDDALYAYYVAILQILNMLSQYENFNMAKQVYYLIYPSLKLFLQQLEQGRKKAELIEDDSVKFEHFEVIMKSVVEYLEAVKNIVYHAIHMEQQYFLLPGYMGLIYEIPMKQCLFYQGYMERVSGILTKGDEECKYCYFITPTIYEKPFTELKDFKLSPGDRLIQVKLSQKDLYMQDVLSLILCHETGHYAGSRIRRRRERVYALVRAFSYILAELLLDLSMKNEELTEMEKEIWMDLYVDIQSDLQECIAEVYNQKLGVELKGLNETDEKFYISNIEKKLLIIAKGLLSGEEGIIDNCFYKRGPRVSKKIKESGMPAYKSYMKIVQHLITNRQILSLEKRLYDWLDNLVYIIREALSDIISLEILDSAGFDQYLRCSFAMERNEALVNNMNRVSRWALVSCIIEFSERMEIREYNRQWQKIQEIQDKRKESVNSKLNENESSREIQRFLTTHTGFYMFSLDGVWNSVIQYLQLCDAEIKKLLSKLESPQKEQLSSIRSIYAGFNKEEISPNVFEEIELFTKEYVKDMQ